MPDINSSRKKEPYSALAVPTKNELRWMARRGMLELDLLLNNFIDNKFNELSSEEKKMLASLLQQEDPVLQSWFFAGDKQVDDLFYDLVISIKNNSQHRS